ncbi:MAG TPA: hypothetical protein VK184_26440 [Nostocaceae cyanobacterium]|nr:hypothetical protein [Nostocaceae cyanobacterium]
MFNFFKKSEDADREQQELKRQFMEEKLRQLRLRFNLALGITTASAMMTLSGVGLLYFNKVEEASLTTGTGILFSISSVQFAKDAKDELEEALRDLQK